MTADAMPATINSVGVGADGVVDVIAHRRWLGRGLLLASAGVATRRSRDGVAWIRIRCGAGVLGSPSRVWPGSAGSRRGVAVNESAAGTVEEVLRLTHRSGRPTGPPVEHSHVGRKVGIGKDAVAKIWADHNLKPWKLDTFKVSNDLGSRRSLSMSSASTWIRRNERRCSALTKRPSAKHWTAPSRRCR